MAAINPLLSTTTKTPFLGHRLLASPPRIFHHRRHTPILLLRSSLQPPHKLPAALIATTLQTPGSGSGPHRHPATAATYGCGGAPLESHPNRLPYLPIITFADLVASHAKLELQEFVDFLKNPDKYTSLGAKIPKGCLLVGPGIAKTLLALAVAGEAGVPFFSFAASEFVELHEGVGASRVRDFFVKAKFEAPCVVFIGEIDEVGRQRGGLGDGNNEREQTINQLLAEMDGFEGNCGVIVFAAANRSDVLDSALLRPGRFDRQVIVDMPDPAERFKILEVHCRGKALAKDVDLDEIASRTCGFSGADLQNLMNEAAILAAQRDLKEIREVDISDAWFRIIAGPERKNVVLTEEGKKRVAYHEAGHALVGLLVPKYKCVAKISIIPRDGILGLTVFVPRKQSLESELYSRSYLENKMAVTIAGRVAEEVIFGKENITSPNEVEEVCEIARKMVEILGFSKNIAQLSLEGDGGYPLLGQQMTLQKDYSMATADAIDSEVMELFERAYDRAKNLITTHIDILHKLANLLIEKETVDGQDIEILFMDGKVELYFTER